MSRIGNWFRDLESTLDYSTVCSISKSRSCTVTLFPWELERELQFPNSCGDLSIGLVHWAGQSIQLALNHCKANSSILTVLKTIILEQMSHAARLPGRACRRFTRADSPRSSTLSSASTIIGGSAISLTTSSRMKWQWKSWEDCTKLSGMVARKGEVTRSPAKLSPSEAKEFIFPC